jgi:putative ABC transport system substrate-binding protein
MRRRDFIAGLGAAVWPLAARAQQPDKVRRIGVLMGFSEQDSEARRWVAAFEQKLAELGWKGGIDLRIEYRWPGGPPDRCSTAADCHGREADQGVACRPRRRRHHRTAGRVIPLGAVDRGGALDFKPSPADSSSVNSGASASNASRSP